jgi:hypothetical protein
MYDQVDLQQMGITKKNFVAAPKNMPLSHAPPLMLWNVLIAGANSM